MKNIVRMIVIIFSLTSMCESWAQSKTPFFEQIAFDFYKIEILQKEAINKKFDINISPKSLYYLSAECLKDKVFNEKKLNNFPINSKQYKLKLNEIDKRQFRIVKTINEYSNFQNFIEVSITTKFNNRIFVVIDQLIEGKGKTYIFEFDKNGNIIDWCLSSKYERLLIN